MKSVALYWCREADEEEFEGDSIEFLVRGKVNAVGYPFSRPAKNPSALEIAEMLDQDAENENKHDMVGAHGWLAELLNKEVGMEAAAKVFRKISDNGGLHNGFSF